MSSKYFLKYYSSQPFGSGRAAVVCRPGTAVGGRGGRAWSHGAWAPVPTAVMSGTSCSVQHNQ